MRILHVITTLSIGGAEVMLRNVVLGLPGTFEHRVVSLSSHEPIGRQLEEAGVEVLSIGAKNSLRLPALAARARRLVERWRPDVVHCWMYHANVFGRVLLGARPGGRPIFIASVRGALGAPKAQRRMLRVVRWIDARTSRIADALLFNSRISASQHQAAGYRMDRSIVIPNGFDTALFAPDYAARERARAALGVGNDVVVGMVARFSPVKGHEVLLKAVALLRERSVPLRVVLAGRGCDHANRELRDLILRLGIDSSVVLLGERNDIPYLLNAFDIVACPSLSESFPNAVGEAMACAVPCVVTNVGDCGYLVGDTGRVARSGDPADLAEKLAELVQAGTSGRRLLGERARARILEHFSMSVVLDKFASMYERLAVARSQAV